MKRKGSITVFLALILALLFSFVLTALEAARIGAANAYASMLSTLAGDSFLASYYFPLFEEYGLLGVDTGYGTTMIQYDRMEAELEEDLIFATDSMQGGILSMTEPEVTLTGYRTLLSGEGDEFLKQVKKQVAYEGIQIALEKLFNKTALQDSVLAGEVYRKQEELQKEAANTVEELLKLMTYVDGIATGKQEIKFNPEGLPQTKTSFIKQLAPLSEIQLQESFDNKQIFNVLKPLFFYPQTAGSNVESCLKEAIRAKEAAARLDSRIAMCEDRLTEISAEQKAAGKDREKWKKAAKEAKEKKEEESYEEAIQNMAQCDLLLQMLNEEAESIKTEKTELQKEKSEEKKNHTAAVKRAEAGYNEIRKKINEVLPLLKEAESVVDSLEKKQKAARSSVFAYELFLSEQERVLSSGLYEAFQSELEQLKLYLGMEEQGYVPETMQKSLRTDYMLLTELALPRFDSGNLQAMLTYTERFVKGIGAYTLEGLWFTYGELRAGEEAGGSITETLQQLLGAKVCELAGVSEEELSKSELSGIELPSASLEKTSAEEGLLEYIARMTKQFSNAGIAEIFSEASDAVNDAVALELYFTEFFGDYRNQEEHTRLAYEREYILFGEEDDTGNLTRMVLSLVAFRSLFTLAALFQNAEKQAQLSSMATAAAGVTGIPLLAAVIKYSLLLLWAVEEAFVEVAALLQGKRILLFSVEGTISAGDLFRFGKELVEKKAISIPDSVIGAAYSDYLLLFSLLESKGNKCCRAMDLIQENIRLRYRDSFRIRMVVTELSFEADMKLTKKWETGFFSKFYHIRQQEAVGY